MYEEFEFEVGAGERHTVAYHYDRWWARVRIKVDGSPVLTRWMLLYIKRIERFEFTVGNAYHVRIEKERKLPFPAFRDSYYRVFVDGELIFTRKG